MPPFVAVVGVYSPSASRAEYEDFLAAQVASRNPINFSDEVKAFLSRVGRADEIVDLHTDELAEIREELERELGGAALVEVLVTEPNGKFSIGAFVQPDPALPAGQWQVAWCEKYLTADGAATLGDFAFNECPSESQFRVAFYIHDWRHELGLNGPYGSIPLPQIEPMPPRLWKLAPYEQVD